MDYNEFNLRKKFILEEALVPFGISSKYKFIDATKINNDYIIEEGIKHNVKDKFPVYVIITWTNTAFGKVISAVTDCRYSHVAMSLDSSLKKLYSFNLVNHTGQKLGGFSIETLKGYLKDYQNSLMCVYTIFLDKIKFETLKKNIDWFINNVKKTHYSFINILAFGLHLPLQLSNMMVCSQFVDTMLKKIGVNVTNKRSSQVSAASFYKSDSEYLYKCYEGEIQKYKPGIVNRIVNKIKNTANVCS